MTATHDAEPKRDDLSIPTFLRREPGVRVESVARTDSTPGQVLEFVEPWQAVINALEPADFRQYVQERVDQGRISRRWLVVREPYHSQNSVDETIAHFRVKFEERKAKAEANAEAARNRLEKVREASPTHGMIPLRRVLEEMGDDAPRRRHAVAAIDAAKLEHVKYHFPRNSPVVIARVQQVIREYVPPVKQKGRHEFDAALVIRWSGKNPKTEGTDAHARWEKLRLHNGKTVGEFVADKGNTTTLKNAIEKGTVKLDGHPGTGNEAVRPAKSVAVSKHNEPAGRRRGTDSGNARRTKGSRKSGRHGNRKRR